ncbi:MAG: hydroxyacylglutathione hydrolase [Gammaproteobacteria bacterium]|nr:hydroxyacylglutathione hydrolase [Gammaproteobacteria bacterium]
MTQLDVRPIPAFQDNYIWLIRGLTDPRAATVVDPGTADPVLQALASDDLHLAAILVTHHHPDHVGGVRELAAVTGAAVFGPRHERLPFDCTATGGGERVTPAATGLDFAVFDVPGHTAGHIAYYGHGALFPGDTLFSAGCGRLFEGTAEQMLASLDTLAALPDSTRVFPAHEYTLANLRFALAADPDNAELAGQTRQAAAEREAGRPTLPTTIGTEKRINPFLRCRSAGIRRSAEQHAGQPLPAAAGVFATIRGWKDGFR